jgi:hypothetical protein
MNQLTVTVPTLDPLYELAGHLAELDFLTQAVAPQPRAAAQSTVQPEASAKAGPHLSSNGDDRPAPDRQVKYLNDLALKAGCDLHVLEERVASLYDLADFAHLTKQIAREPITRLLNNDLHPRLSE